VKDSSANIVQMNTLLYDHADKITFLNGEDILMLPALHAEGAGMVMGIANFMAPALANCTRLVRRRMPRPRWRHGGR